MTRSWKWALLPAALTALWLLMMALGTGALDRTLLQSLYAVDRPGLRAAAEFVTMFGEWQFLLPLTLIAGGILLLIPHARQQGLFFLSICLIGRLLVHLQKTGIGRLRPEDREHLVPVQSHAFPSGHATNSMIVYLAVAFVVAPARHRFPAVLVALLGSILVGLSRPILGVHWPSDVIGGWSFGAAWVLLLLGLTGRWPFGRNELEAATRR